MEVKTKTEAFTLIELLVVTAVIAVLMAILLPALQRAKNQARGIFCLNNTKTLAMAWLMYKDDHDAKLVGGLTGKNQWVDNPENDTSVDPLERKKEAVRRGRLYRYMGDNVNAYHCPADERTRIATQLAFRSYSIAGGLNGMRIWGGSGFISHLRYGTIKHPATKYVFLEESDPRGSNRGSWLMNPKTKRWVDPFAIFHSRNRSTLGYADGHAEMHRWLSKGVIEWCEQSTDPANAGSYRFGREVNTDDPLEIEDLAFALKGFAYRKLI